MFDAAYNILLMLDTLAIGTPVRTKKPAQLSIHWTEEEMRQRKRWGCPGSVVDRVDPRADANAVIYEVEHEDGTRALYERRELLRTDVSEHTSAELAEIITKMRAVSNQFYAGAVMTGMHAFIEFAGLMNEFILLCAMAQKEGLDFTMASTHTGKALPMEAPQASYLAEKLNCIYGPALLKNEEARRAFIAILFEGAYVLRPSPRAAEVTSHAETGR
jgi:hypothetical protein